MSDLTQLYALYNDDEKGKEFKKSIDDLRVLSHSMSQLADDKKEVLKHVKEKYKVKPGQVNKLLKMMMNPNATIESEIEELDLLKDFAIKLNGFDDNA